MEVILLESFNKLGKIGDIVKVKDGFARNYLIPQKKALRANKENKVHFTKIKQDLIEKNEKIIFNSNWSKNQFLKNLPNDNIDISKISVVHQSTSKTKIDFKYLLLIIVRLKFSL